MQVIRRVDLERKLERSARKYPALGRVDLARSAQRPLLP